MIRIGRKKNVFEMCMLSGAITAISFLLICCTFGIKRVELAIEKLFIIIIINIYMIHRSP